MFVTIGWNRLVIVPGLLISGLLLPSPQPASAQGLFREPRFEVPPEPLPISSHRHDNRETEKTTPPPRANGALPNGDRAPSLSDRHATPSPQWQPSHLPRFREERSPLPAARPTPVARNRFGLKTHLISSHSPDFGVRQRGDDARQDDSVRTSDDSDRQEQSGFGSPQPESILFDPQETDQLESIEGIESLPGEGLDDNIPANGEFPSDRSINGREIIRERYPDGKVKIEREVAQDKEGNYFNHGFWRVLSPKGALIASGQYDHGVMQGEWQRQHTKESSGLFSTTPFNLFQGPFLSTATFKDGKLDGIWTLSDFRHRKIFEIPYRKGKRHGTAYWWYPSMNRMREATFRNGLLDGPLREWDRNNKLTRDDRYVEGKRIIRQVNFYRPRQKESEKYYLDAKLVVEGEDNWWDAQPAPLKKSGQRIQHGPVQAWYDNGQPKMKGRYLNGVRVGPFSWWHRNGNKQLSGTYNSHGQKIGVWTWRHPNGMKAIEGTYEDNVPVGIWKWWDTSGKVKSVKDLSHQHEESEGNRHNPAPLPEGNSATPAQPSTPDKSSPEDDDSFPLMIEQGDLEGITPLEPGEMPDATSPSPQPEPENREGLETEPDDDELTFSPDDLFASSLESE